MRGAGTAVVARRIEIDPPEFQDLSDLIVGKVPKNGTGHHVFQLCFALLDLGANRGCKRRGAGAAEGLAGPARANLKDSPPEPGRFE